MLTQKDCWGSQAHPNLRKLWSQIEFLEKFMTRKIPTTTLRGCIGKLVEQLLNP